MKRADSPISKPQRLILALLQANPRGLRGLELVKESNGELRRSTIYIHLDDLQIMGLVDARPEPATEAPLMLLRPIYTLTKRGLRQPVEKESGTVFAVLVVEFLSSIPRGSLTAADASCTSYVDKARSRVLTLQQ